MLPYTVRAQVHDLHSYNTPRLINRQPLKRTSFLFLKALAEISKMLKPKDRHTMDFFVYASQVGKTMRWASHSGSLKTCANTHAHNNSQNR